MNRSAYTSTLALAGASFLLLGGCLDADRDEVAMDGIALDGEGDDSGGGEDGGAQLPESPEIPGVPEHLVLMFEHASAEFDVPMAILVAVGKVETRLEMVEGSIEFEGRDPAMGIMGLRGINLEEAAALAGVTVVEASTQPDSNIRAAAALLSAMADQQGVGDRNNFSEWVPVLGTYSGIESDVGKQAYVFDEIMQEMPQVLSALGPLEIGMAPPEPLAAAGPDYAGSIWRASPNNSARPGGAAGDPNLVIIHTCEGSYSGCWSWLTNANAGVSAHYVINNSGSEISQLVAESRKAWHIGASYKCSLNNNVDCNLNGTSSNSFTIGIEHAGYSNQSSWDQGLLDASAALVCDITQDQSIPRDQYHIVGHGQLQPYNRVDPGPNWPWSDYLNSVQSYCGDGPDPDPDPPDPDPDPDPPDPDPDPDPPVPAPNIEIIIDSNESLNGWNASMGVSDAWAASSSAIDFNTGYWWHSTQAISDAAVFSFYLTDPAQLTVDAWWVSGGNRSTAAPFLMFDSSGQKLDTVYADQSTNGGQWNQLGTYDFQAGWNHVDLSVWAGAGSVVVADALRVHSP